MEKLFKMVFILIVLMAVGCGFAPKGTGPIFTHSPPSPEKARVYHYRLKRLMGNGLLYYLYMDGKFAGLIGNGGYDTQEIPAGEHEYSVVNEIRMVVGMDAAAIANAMAKAEKVITFTAEPNKTYYFRWNATEWFRAEEVDEEIAIKELEGLKQFELF
jgi:hypothetical protein